MGCDPLSKHPKWETETIDRASRAVLVQRIWVGGERVAGEKGRMGS